MKNQEEIGLILRRFLPQKQTFSIFFHEAGKEQVLIDPPTLGLRLWPGSIISCVRAFDNKPVVIAHDVQILAVPLHHDAAGLAWLHHLLEICYYFLPPSYPARDVFNLIYASLRFFAGTTLLPAQVAVLKTLCIAKVLTQLDHHPQPWLIPGMQLFDACIEKSVDFADARAVDLLQHVKTWSAASQRARLEAWIAACIAQHPQGTFLRTVAFLYDPAGVENEQCSSQS